MILNRLTVVTVDSIPATKQYRVPTISTKTEESINLDKIYYHVVYVFLKFNKKGNNDTKEENTEMEANMYQEQMEDVRLDNERQRHWRMVFEYNKGGIDQNK